MPSQNAHTYLELPANANIDPVYQRQLNDALRQIARQFDSLSTGSGAKQTVSSSSGGGTTTTTGGEVILSVPGTLAIDDNVTPLFSYPADFTPAAIVAVLKQTSNGQTQAQINVAGLKYAVVTIAVNQTLGSVGGTFAKIPANALVTVDIIAVGSQPGAGLTLMVR